MSNGNGGFYRKYVFEIIIFLIFGAYAFGVGIVGYTYTVDAKTVKRHEFRTTIGEVKENIGNQLIGVQRQLDDQSDKLNKVIDLQLELMGRR